MENDQYVAIEDKNSWEILKWEGGDVLEKLEKFNKDIHSITDELQINKEVIAKGSGDKNTIFSSNLLIRKLWDCVKDYSNITGNYKFSHHFGQFVNEDKKKFVKLKLSILDAFEKSRKCINYIIDFETKNRDSLIVDTTQKNENSSENDPIDNFNELSVEQSAIKEKIDADFENIPAIFDKIVSAMLNIEKGFEIKMSNTTSQNESFDNKESLKASHNESRTKKVIIIGIIIVVIFVALLLLGILILRNRKKS